jgi:hypothetical protein
MKGMVMKTLRGGNAWKGIGLILLIAVVGGALFVVPALRNPPDPGSLHVPSMTNVPPPGNLHIETE